MIYNLCFYGGTIIIAVMFIGIIATLEGML